MEMLVIILGIEAILFCITALCGIYWNKKLAEYLRRSYPDFYKSKLDTPILAGGPEVFLRHLGALKYTYWGVMPDRLSSFYQRRSRFCVIMGAILLGSLFLTIIIPLLMKFKCSAVFLSYAT